MPLNGIRQVKRQVTSPIV